ncbi:fungal-specific transcription factor domain-containing protein [Talaromyces proteolyticus]|uniref:Fungal-specific transcription factor domain-containing protein n=1 Tax=Talaromyces proteolyticus TaxID=1131652 RepID=A0AAD4KXA4_9EURO|nr:fungal-specific transcription factor domain-containing protein [Talaromyces proteolyticus]KAH8702204.1 fungal-specific transcription factor domain-containing protein [Talaromyces proteolyticus]
MGQLSCAVTPRGQGDCNDDIRLPNYIEHAPSHITKKDLDYLQSKGALGLPHYKVQMKQWKAYWKYAYPCNPILDPTEIMNIMQGHKSRTKISLFLFQCVLLVGRLFLDIHEGSCTNSVHLQAMFQKIRLLYNLGWETNPFVVLKSLLLMTWFPQSVDESKGQAYWITQAVSLAFRIGLHRDPSQLDIEQRLRSLRKRLWWCLYVRERTLNLDAGLPWIIDENDYDVPMITIHDFELVPPSCGFEDNIPFAELGAINRQRQIALMSVERAALMVLVGRLPSISIHIADRSKKRPGKPLLHTHGQRLNKLSIDEFDYSLDQWMNNLPPEVNYHGSNSLASWVGDGQLYMHCTMLRLSYSIVRLQSAALRYLQNKSIVDHRSRKMVSAACFLIIDLIEELNYHEYSAYVPLYGFSTLRPVLIWAIISQEQNIKRYQGFPQLLALQYKVGKADPYYLLFQSYLQHKNITMKEDTLYLSP